MYMVITRYKNGRISIRDKPYKTLPTARRAVNRISENKLKTVKAIEIYRAHADINSVDVKRYI